MEDEARGQVGIGCHVVVEMTNEQGDCETLEFDLVQDKAADFSRGQVSAESPLGRAVRGTFTGDEVDYRIGDIRRVRIVSVGPAEQDADPEAAARRQKVLDEARCKAERTNADMFASSFSGKWGDYSTDDIIEDDTDK